MKITQEKIVESLPKLIVLAIAFYNFAWTSWQNSQGCSGLICPWYNTGEFHYPQFSLLIASFLLFIPRIWSYSISVLTSGYFAISWVMMAVKWLWTTDYSLSYRIEITTSSYFGNPLQIWESQLLIAVTIFSFAGYFLWKMIKQSNFVNGISE